MNDTSIADDNTVYDSDGSILGTFEYEYDEAGKKTKKVVYDTKGRLLSKHELDARGNVVKDFFYDMWEEETSSNIYMYDVKGTLLKKTYYNKYDQINKIEEYAEDGSIIPINIQYKVEGSTLIVSGSGAFELSARPVDGVFAGTIGLAIEHYNS